MVYKATYNYGAHHLVTIMLGSGWSVSTGAAGDAEKLGDNVAPELHVLVF